SLRVYPTCFSSFSSLSSAEIDKTWLSKSILKSDFFNPGTAISTTKASANSLMFTLGSEMPVLKLEANKEGKSANGKSSNQVDIFGKFDNLFLLLVVKPPFFVTVAKLLMIKKF